MVCMQIFSNHAVVWELGLWMAMLRFYMKKHKAI